ncbi:hypothetical protein [Thermomonospora sp. CIF 1]|uniref:hypothetical protein n=1 Tax=Thermomonospora sp. CIF 1 TaxID=1916083 RepID=UPI000CA77446|nr:hypothetical protein [Thermomonospora sp. CIF 1]PKK12778.1 MAG: hypothetical protein BUE48_020835 [Thermomonospora sp. CIF 1]
MNLPHPNPLAHTPALTAADAPGPAVLADLQREIGAQWITWHGQYTRRYWAMPRPPFPWLGLVEGRTPADLLARVREVQAHYGPRGRR